MSEAPRFQKEGRKSGSSLDIVSVCLCGVVTVRPSLSSGYAASVEPCRWQRASAKSWSCWSQDPGGRLLARNSLYIFSAHKKSIGDELSLCTRIIALIWACQEYTYCVPCCQRRPSGPMHASYASPTRLTYSVSGRLAGTCESRLGRAFFIHTFMCCSAHAVKTECLLACHPQAHALPLAMLTAKTLAVALWIHAAIPSMACRPYIAAQICAGPSITEARTNSSYKLWGRSSEASLG